MKKLFIKAAVLIAAAALAMPLSSCSGDSDSSDGNSGGSYVVAPNDEDAYISADELPYGTTLTKLTAGVGDVPVSIEYDNRFMSEEEATLVSRYLTSLGTQDADMLEETAYPELLDYTLEILGAESAQYFADTEYELFKEYIGADYTFDYFLVNNVLTTGEYDFSYYDNDILAIAPDAKITDRKYVEVECQYVLKDGEGSGSLSTRIGNDLSLCIYTINGKIYVLT